MPQIAFYGASDDLIEVEGELPGCDEYNGEKAIFVVDGLRIIVEYVGAAGVWSIKVSQLSEESPVAAKNLQLSIQPLAVDSNLPGYSMRLEMEVSDGATVVREYEGSA